MDTDNKLMENFGSIKVLRSHINQLHNWLTYLFIGIISVICDTETWKKMIEFANSRKRVQLFDYNLFQ